ncbi:MAG: heparinase II/III family protein [Spirochaetota bacterium]
MARCSVIAFAVLTASLFASDMMLDRFDSLDTKTVNARKNAGVSLVAAAEHGQVLRIAADFSETSYTWARKMIPAGTIRAPWNAISFFARGAANATLQITLCHIAGTAEVKYSASYTATEAWKRYTIRLSDFRGKAPLTDDEAAKITIIFFNISKSSGDTAVLEVDDLSLTVTAPKPAAAMPSQGIPVMQPYTAKKLPPVIVYDSFLLTRDEVNRMKSAMPADETIRKSIETLITAAQAQQKNPPVIPDRGAQHTYWYICKKDSSMLTTVSPTKHRCPLCGAEYSGEPFDSVPLMAVHSGLADRTKKSALAFLFTGESAYAKDVFAVLSGYAEKYASFELHDVNGKQGRAAARVFPQTLDESMWIIDLAQSYAAIRGTLDASQKETLRTKLFRPVYEVIVKNDAGVGNWQSWHNAAMLACGLALEDTAIIDEAVNGKSGFLAQMQSSFGDDGIWYEGSWGYHFYALQALIAFSELAYRAGIDLYTHPRFKPLFTSSIYSATPSWTLPQFGDDKKPISIFGKRSFYEVAYARYRDDVFAWVLSRSGRGGIASLATGVFGVNAPIAMPDLSSALFPDAGIAALRTGMTADDPYIGFKFGPHGGFHGHFDKLSVVSHALGEMLAPDPGCLESYGAPLHTEWYKTSFAHNTLTVDGRSQNPCAGTRAWFSRSPHIRAVAAAVRDAYDGVTLTRRVVLFDRYALIVDSAESTEEHQYDWVWHNYGTPTFDRALSPIKSAGDKDGYQHAKNCSAVTADDAWHVRFSKGERNVHIAMDGAAGNTMISATGFGVNVREQVPLVIARRQALTTHYISAIEAYRDTNEYVRAVRSVIGDGTRLPAGALYAACATADGVDRILIGSGELSIDGISSDGACTVISSNDTAIRIMLVNGTHASYRGNAFTLSRKATATVERMNDGGIYIECGENAAAVTLKNAAGNISAYTLAPDHTRSGSASIQRTGNDITAALTPGARIELAVSSVYADTLARERATRRSAQRPSLPIATIPSDARPTRGISITVEAENMAEQGKGAAEACDKFAASGQAIRKWNDAGHWIAWDVTVPENGIYHMSVKYCSEMMPVRDLTIDNAYPHEACREISFDATGGWSSTANDWREPVLSDASGTPVPIYLTKGTHRIRMANLSGEGGMNLDHIRVFSPNPR